MSAAPSIAALRGELARRFPGVVAMPSEHERHERHHPLLEAPFAWVEVSIGQGGLAWLAAWTLLQLARDPLGRPALWVDTHGTLTPGDLLDLEGRLVVVRPADPLEAHVAADVALRTGSFSIVALEMHRALHPTPLARLARLATSRHGDARTPVVVWGEPPAFVGPPSGLSRTTLVEALGALFEGTTHDAGLEVTYPRPASGGSDLPSRALHTTDRLRPLERAPDRRPPPPHPSPRRANVDDAPFLPVDHVAQKGPK